MKPLICQSRHVERIRVGMTFLLVMGTVCYSFGSASAAVTITVSSDGTAEYRSIQAAIDAAPDHARIQIAAGSYDERLVIGKPLTLEGEGWQSTKIANTNDGKPWDFEALQREFVPRLQEAPSDEERRALLEAFKRNVQELSHLLDCRRGQVILRGLRFSLPALPLREGLLAVPIIEVHNSSAELEDCALVGSPGNGLRVVGRSTVRVRNCLVAGCWGTGIVIGARRGDEAGLKAEAEIIGCEVRNCYYAGIVVRRQDFVSIRGCRISGAAWHGIRYDDASPTIADNLIFSNARSGIYASGETGARVIGNVFWGNGHNGMSCWFQNGDTIEHNTFVANHRAGIEVLGSSEPQVRRNLFAMHPAAVTMGNIGSDSPYARVADTLDFTHNFLWQNGQAVIRWRPRENDSEPRAHDPMEVDASNRIGGPQLGELPRDSSVGAPGLGASGAIVFDSPWPLQPEEHAMIPPGHARDSRLWQRDGR